MEALRNSRGPAGAPAASAMVIAYAVTVSGGAPAPEWYPYPAKYNAWQEARPFLMAAMHNCVPRDHLAERTRRFQAAGLNTLIWCKPHRALHAFEAANNAGLEWACGSRGGTEAIAAAMEIPGCSFVLAGDEPSRAEELPEIAAISDWVRKEHPQIPVFANLSITKIDHDLYVETCRPDVFSFDHYPLQRDGRTHDNDLYDLAWGLQTARRYQLPYWMYIQAMGREAEKARSAYRIPDEADMRFLAFSFLAHGGTGIMLFVYYGYPEAMVDDLGVEREGSAGPSLHRYENTVVSRAWYAVRDLAPEVQNLSRALINLRPTGEVAYSGNGTLWDHPPPTYSRHNPKLPVTLTRFQGRGRLKSVDIAGDDNLGALVSFFVDKAGEEHFMVVNLMHGANLSKCDGARAVRMTFARDVARIERLNRHTGAVEALETVPGPDGTRALTIHIEGGTGDLFKWHNGRPWALR